MIKKQPLKSYLNWLVSCYNTPSFIASDPIQFPRHFSEPKDIEIAALLTAVITWGKRPTILKSCDKMFQLMDNQPYSFIMNGQWQILNPQMNIHRTFFVRDLQYLCNGLKNIYLQHESMEDFFVGVSPWVGVGRLREALLDANGGLPSKHISDPKLSHNTGSACKRMHLMLRWLVRNDGIVDIGLWHNVSPASLMIPLDVHVAEVGRDLGLIKRAVNDRKTVVELTDYLRTFDPNDPVKYDFALFGYGIAHSSTPK